MRKPRIRCDESLKGLGTFRDYFQAASQIRLPILWAWQLLYQSLQTLCNRLDGRQRIINFVSQDSNQTLLGQAFLFVQCTSQVGKEY